ncbi:hypothetical protein TNCV_767961 [Trichonephila clavipes]|nr:hypothetical protein TNCV_767961 [Trichonephila clavipes]
MSTMSQRSHLTDSEAWRVVGRLEGGQTQAEVAQAIGVSQSVISSVWTLVPVRLDQQLSDHSTVDEIASGAADCRLTYTMANCPQRRRTRKKKKRARKRRGLVVLGSREENPRVWFRGADQESKTRMRNKALRTGRRQAVE